MTGIEIETTGTWFLLSRTHCEEEESHVYNAFLRK